MQNEYVQKFHLQERVDEADRRKEMEVVVGWSTRLTVRRGYWKQLPSKSS